MNEKYEDKLWGQIELLHQKNKRQQTSFNYFMDMLNKFQEACSEFSKNIQGILSKGHEIIEYHSTSMFEAVEKFINLFEIFNKEFKEAQNVIKKQIIDQILKPTNDLFNKEKDFYNSYNKCKTHYVNSRLALDKCRQNYENGMKLCENFIFNSKQIDFMIYAGEEEKVKNAKNANNSIKNTKPIEEKYISAIDTTNKAREAEIKKHTELLQFYQKMDINFYEKIKYGIGIYLSVALKTCKNILSTSELLENEYNKISVEKDVLDFIEKNKVEKKGPRVSKFIPYVPQADPTNRKEETVKLDIYYEVIKTLKANFKDIRNDIDMEEETKRKRLRYLCERIFKFGNNVSFSPEEKSELLSFLEIPNYRKYFIVVLSKQRTKGRFKRSESLVKDLAEILLRILDLAEKEKDYESAKNCIILSQTYFYEKGDEKKKKDKNDSLKKIYLFEFIKNNSWLRSNDFWDGLITLMINVEVKKNQESSAKQGIEETEKFVKSRLSNICFSQLLTFTSNMIEFGMDKKEVQKLVDDYTQRFEIQKELSETIYANIIAKSEEIEEAIAKDKSTNKNNQNKENPTAKEVKTENIIKEENIKKDEEIKEENKNEEAKDIIKEENKNEENNENKEKEQINEVKTENENKIEENKEIELNEKKEEKIENKEIEINKENEINDKKEEIEEKNENEENKKEINTINEEEKKEEINKVVNEENKINEENDENKNEDINPGEEIKNSEENQNVE